MNKELLGKIADAIEAQPNQFDMYVLSTESECGTVYCIAGWALLLSTDELTSKFNNWSAYTDWASKAGAVLDVDYDQGYKIFFHHEWPCVYREKYIAAYAKEEQSFIQTGKLSRKESSKVAVQFIRDLVDGVIEL